MKVKESEICDHYIIGAGAVGLFLAANLVDRSRLSIVVKTESVENYLRQNLALQGFANGQNQVCWNRFSLLTSDSSLDSDRSKVIWLSVKSYDLERAIRLVPNNSIVVLPQNGLGIAARAKGYTHSKTDIAIIRMFPMFGVYKTSPTKAVFSGQAVADLATDMNDPNCLIAIKYLRHLLEGIGCRITISESVDIAEWRKLAINIVVNPICCLLNQPNGIILRELKLHAIVQAVLKEYLQLAEMLAVKLGPITFQSLLKQISLSADNICSSLSDLRARRESELPDLFNSLITQAKRSSLEIPNINLLNELLVNFSIDRPLTIEQLGLAFESLKHTYSPSSPC